MSLELRHARGLSSVARGFRVVTASNTQDARAILSSSKVELVLLDITLPGEDGLSLARHLREHGGRLSSPWTGARDQVLDRVVGLEVGADDYVTSYPRAARAACPDQERAATDGGPERCGVYDVLHDLRTPPPARRPSR